MAIENGFFLQTNDDGSTTLFQCKYYSCYEDMIQDTNPPHYGICEDTCVIYKFDPVHGWEKSINKYDTSAVTATAGSMLEGVIAVNATGEEVIGNIPTVIPTIEDNIITVPKGYIDEEQTFEVEEMEEPSVSDNVVTIPVGYNKTEKDVAIPEAEILHGMSEGSNVIRHSLSISKGYIPEENSWTFDETDLTGINATEDNMLSGTISVDASGQKITGNIQTVIPSIENGVVIVPKGYIEEPQSFDIGSSGGSSMDFFKCAAVYGPREVICYKITGCPNSEYNGIYLPTEFETSGWEDTYPVYKHENNNLYYFYNDGYMEWGLGADYNESSFDYRGSGTYWYDRDWMDVAGMSCEESTATVDIDVPKTWDGYKAVQSGGAYTFESEATTGLTYTDLKPEKYKIYSADASVKIDWLPEDFPTENLILFAPLTSDLDKAEIGGAIMHSKTSELGTLDNTNCAVFTNSNDGIYIDCDGIIGTGELTVFLQFAIATFNQGEIFNIRSINGGQFGLSPVGGNNQNVRFNSDAAYTQTIEQNQWYTVLLVRRKKGELSLFFDGEFKHQYTFTGNILHTLQLGYNWFNGGIRNVLIYNRALSEAEIGQLIDKFGLIYPPQIIVKSAVSLIAYMENEVSKQLSATVKYKPGETPTFSSSDLPAGLSISSDGRITGTPTSLGQGSSTVTVSAPGVDNVQFTVNWEVRAASEKPIVSEDLIFYAPLSIAKPTAETGQILTYTGTPQATTLNGRSCMLFSSGQGIETDENIGISGNMARTVCFWALPAEYVPEYTSAVFWGSDNGEQNKRVLFGPQRNGDNIRLMFGGWVNDTEFSTDIKLDNKLHHCAMVYTGSELRLFVDGVHGGGSVSGLNTTDSKLRIAYASVASGYAYSGYLAEVRVYNRALSDAEISELANEFSSGGDINDDNGDSGNGDSSIPRYVVNGAGTDECNGTYILKDGSTNVYKNTANKYELTVHNTSGTYYDTEVVMSIGYYDEEYMLEFVMYNATWLDSLGALKWDVNGGEMPIPTVEFISSGSNDSGDSGSGNDKIYVYTVSGAGTPGIDGNYYDTGETTKGPMGDDLGFHIYTNGTAKLEFMIEYSQWSLSLDGSQKYSINWADDTMASATTSLVFGDNPTPTITKYAGGDNAGVSDKTYLYTVSGAGTASANGDYWDSGEVKDGYPIYTNGTCYLYYFGDDGWWMIDTDLVPSFMYHAISFDVMPDETAWAVEDGTAPAPTVTAYAGGGGGGTVNTYRIFGCPSTAYDGDYQLTDQTSTLCTMMYKKVGDTEKHLVKTTNGQWIVGFYDPEGGYDSDAYLGQYRINSDDPVNGVWFDDAMGDDCPGMSCTVIN